jgi:hypothetical protein
MLTVHTSRAPAKPDPAEQWRPHSTPGFEVNGEGRLRTAGHKPQEAQRPWPKKPEPAVEPGTAADWTEFCLC